MRDPDPKLVDQTIDLTNCDREPIHILGRVQSYGCLIAVSSDWIVAHASTNCHDILGHEAEALVGMPLSQLFPSSTRHDLRSKMQTLAYQDTSARIFAYPLFEDDRLFDVSVHQSDRYYVFEFEPRTDGGALREDTLTVQALVGRLRRRKTLDKMLQEAAVGLKVLTGIDRVMVYRFEEDDSGTVIAEASEPNLESFLGLRYPASDIPKQARILYTRNLLRIIPDIDAETFPIHPAQSPTGQDLDLSLAVTRAVSTIHLEYLRNMGVGASMSVSILRKGKLWGLFACHHYSPFYVDFEKRTAIELFAQLVNYELAEHEMGVELQEIDQARQLHDSLMSQLSSGANVVDAFELVADRIAEVIPFDGVAIYSNGHYRARGSTPTEEEFMGLARFLNTTPTSEVYITDSLAERYPNGDGFVERAAGLLALPISRTPRDYLVLFRRELRQSVKWAGNPQKPVEIGPHGARLTPRKSFEAWQEVVRGKSVPWRDSERRAADALRVTLLEVVLKLADETNAMRRRAQEQQELLIAELNHRVRNILNLIRGLVSQGRGDATTVDEYSAVLDARIQSLARAHDQLTDREWGWVSLKTLIRNETKAFLSDKSGRVHVEGDDVELSPPAFTTMALVVHELVTNSAKYGSLSDSSGSVHVDIRLAGDGAMTLGWTERNGPPVKAPKRRGFGTTIVENSIPFELNGTAEVHYRVTGLEAEFSVPTAHVRASQADEKPEAEAPEVRASEVKLEGTALVLEDNMIIAMDAHGILEELGARSVHIASRVSDGLRILDQHPIAFALIDVNLGDELSLAVAERCSEMGIPSLLATGYGASEDIVQKFPPMPILRKPYSDQDVRRAVADLLR